ncbi:MAG: ribonuclease III [Planctomycetota bacterium]|jgi:ribonuclease-3
MTDGNISDLEVLVGHVFRDKGLIFNALSHSSTKADDRPSNERLEFLGDSVLGMLLAEALYRRYGDADEGMLTRIKSQAVSRATLERVATAMGLERYILVGKGVKKKTIPSSLLGNLFEAIIGAIYLDAGLAASRKFILRHLDVIVDEIVEDRAERNYKSLLQHYCQRELGAMPSYRVLRESGPAHGRFYEVAAVVKGEEVGLARANSKKEAEQGAARAAMLHYKAVDEKPIETVRGAGTVLRFGPEGKKKKKTRRGGRKRRRKDREPEAAAPAAEEKPREPEPSRRSRGGRRRKKKKTEATVEAKPEAAAPPAPRKKATKKKAARKKAAKKKTAKKKAARKKATRKKAPAGESAQE